MAASAKHSLPTTLAQRNNNNKEASSQKSSNNNHHNSKKRQKSGRENANKKVKQTIKLLVSNFGYYDSMITLIYPNIVIPLVGVVFQTC